MAERMASAKRVVGACVAFCFAAALRVLGLRLASVGVYGLMAFVARQRTQEIGVRLALGAQHRDVLGMVIRHGMGLTAACLGLGLVAAFSLRRFLRSVLYEVSETNPITFLAAALLLVLVALVACWVPARRAARVDLMVALRYE